MPIIEFSERDILRSKIVTPDWYRVRVERVLPEKLSDKGNKVWMVEGTILFNATNGSTEFAGVPTPAGWNFNSAAVGFMVGFFEALGQEVKPGARFELINAVGKELDIMFENDIYQGNPVNRVNHKYRKPREVQAAQ